MKIGLIMTVIGMAALLCGCGNSDNEYSYNGYEANSPYERTDRLIAAVKEELRQLPSSPRASNGEWFNERERKILSDCYHQKEFLERVQESARKNNSYMKW